MHNQAHVDAMYEWEIDSRLSKIEIEMEKERLADNRYRAIKFAANERGFWSNGRFYSDADVIERFL